MKPGRAVRVLGGGLVTGVATAAVAGVVAERRIARRRRRASAAADALGSLHSGRREVHTEDGLVLHAEVDELTPDGTAAGGHPDGPTIVFAHGYCLNLDCWHFQRERLRGKYRMVFYDQRSHGRSDRSPREATDIEQLGRDLHAVIEQLAPRGPVVLVGHSMGGMSIMALAEQSPDLLRDRVAGVALLATAAGDLRPARILSRLVPDGAGSLAATRLVATLAKAPELVDTARRGSNIGFLAAGLFAFGGDVPAEQVDFLDRMLSQTPFGVIADFYPSLTAHEKYDALARLDRPSTVVVGGVRDRITPIEHTRRLGRLMPHASVIEVPRAGHMVIFEAAEQVTDLIARLAPAGGHR